MFYNFKIYEYFGQIAQNINNTLVCFVMKMLFNNEINSFSQRCETTSWAISIVKQLFKIVGNKVLTFNYDQKCRPKHVSAIIRRCAKTDRREVCLYFLLCN